MRILLLNQFFWPDSAATSQLLTDLARGLAENGHEVYAIAADGGYAPDATGDAPPVQIVRVKALPFVRGKLGRVMSYASFYAGAAVAGLRLPRPDLVLTLTTPPLLSLLGNLLQRVRGSRHFIWEMDMYPDVAIDLGTFRAGGVLDRVVGGLADFSRRRADGIIALGECSTPATWGWRTTWTRLRARCWRSRPTTECGLCLPGRVAGAGNWNSLWRSTGFSPWRCGRMRRGPPWARA